MRQLNAKVAQAIDRLMVDSIHFPVVVEWLECSLKDSIAELLVLDKDTIQTGQGYARALSDLLDKINSTRATLDRAHKRDTLKGLNQAGQPSAPRKR